MDGHGFMIFSKKNIFKKINIMIILLPPTFVLLFTIYLLVYYKIIKPYYVYNINYIENYKEEDGILKKEYYDFYNFIKYKQYSENYETNFYYNFIFKTPCSIFPILTENYAYYGYSYIVKAENDYDILKKNILDNYSFLKTPVEYGNYYEFYKDISINGFIFNEINYTFIDFKSEDERVSYECNGRKVSFWFSYNDQKREVVFSILDEGTSFGNYASFDILKEHLYNNLYT